MQYLLTQEEYDEFQKLKANQGKPDLEGFREALHACARIIRKLSEPHSIQYRERLRDDLPELILKPLTDEISKQAGHERTKPNT